MHLAAIHREIDLAKRALREEEEAGLEPLRLELIALGVAHKPRRAPSKRAAAKAARKAARHDLVGQEFDPCTEHCEPGYQCPERYRHAVNLLEARIARRIGVEPEPQLVMDPDEGWRWRY